MVVAVVILVVVAVVVVAVVAVVVVVVAKIKLYEKENFKIVTIEMGAAKFYFLINDKRIIYKLKSLSFTLKQRGCVTFGSAVLHQ